MSFASGFADTSDKFRELQNREIADTEASAARLTALRQAEVARRMPAAMGSLPAGQPPAAAQAPVAPQAGAPAAPVAPFKAEPTPGAWRGRDSTGRNGPAAPDAPRTHLWHAEGSDPNVNTPYLEGLGKAFALPFQAVGKVARAVVSAPGSGGPFDSQRPAAPGGDKLAALREAEVNRNVQAARANQPAGGTAPLSVRNNNPGNLKFVGQPGATPDARGFAVFQSPEAGAQAADRQLALYMQRDGLNTVRGIVNKWSPVSDPGNAAGSTANYANYVARQLGINPDQPLSVQDIPRLRQAMSQFEAGTTQGASQPQQQTAQAGQPQQPAAQAGGMAPQDVEALIQEQMTRGKAQLDYLQQMANVTRDPATIQKIRGEYEGIQNAMREAELYQAAQTGRISPEQYQMLSARAQQASAASQQKRMEEMYKAEGQMRVEGVKGDIALRGAEFAGNQAQQLELLKLQSLGYKPHSNAQGDTYWFKGDDIRKVAPDGTLVRVQTAAGPQAPSFFDQ